MSQAFEECAGDGKFAWKGLLSTLVDVPVRIVVITDDSQSITEVVGFFELRCYDHLSSSVDESVEALHSDLRQP